MRYVLILLVMLLANVANAIDCQKLPSCEELGYSKEDVKGCADNGYLTCPFDESYKKCINYDCETLGFTNSDKTSWCADLIKCKGNSQMTLCQKACVATKYEELKDLAESGKCKLITMKNDITIPQNESIRLAADTIIDGGGHTLQSSGNRNFALYKMYDKSGFKNIIIKHNQSENQNNFFVFKSEVNTYNMTLHNTQILVQSNDAENHATPVFLHGTYEISGKFTADIRATRHYVLAWANLIFKDADINVTAENDDGVMGEVDFIDSQGSLTFATDILHEHTFTFKNSQIHLNSSVVSWTDSRKFGTILLKNNAEVKLTFSNLINGSTENVDKLAHIKFETSPSAPAKLIIEGSGKLDSGDVTASNTTDTLVLNGVTYHPKKAGTTLLSEIESSGYWERE